jgi:hypothetical protein
MHRSQAIQLIAEYMLSQLKPQEAVEAIQAFFSDFIPPTIILSDPRYQPVLLHQMKRRLRGVTNAYLGAYMHGVMNLSEDVHGEMKPLLSCPVCDFHSLPIRGNWDVCPVCGWTSDPVQEAVPDETVGANNVSLNQARQNFARIGLSSANVRDRLHPHGKHMYPHA